MKSLMFHFKRCHLNPKKKGCQFILAIYLRRMLIHFKLIPGNCNYIATWEKGKE